ncbi:hypothetical protein K2173_000114 [Erythroxylum novogranatense]|uniref:Macrophage migration inhibitory factor n=1 Tax=Erythroxylum novogranatense TaxID=1862640 RepID=A0AAV8SPA0_9ROSI|nr:hypothetical protein K2173_000114 [Erythroxylum novogranatense]
MKQRKGKGIQISSICHKLSFNNSGGFSPIVCVCVFFFLVGFLSTQRICKLNHSMLLTQQYVMIVLKGSVPMAFGGTEQPAANGELVSIGGLDPDVNKKLNAAISSILEKKLSVPKSRFFFKFFETKGYNFGWNGSTF